MLSLPLFSAFALRSGDKSVELTGVKWLTGSPLRMYFSERSDGRAEYRAVVFLLTHSGNSADTLRMLEQLALRYRDLLRIAVVTPDPESDARMLLKAVPEYSSAFGIDRERKLTQQYMAGSMLYPMAFVTGPGGVIVWNGEAVDLPEMLESAVKSPVDVDRQQKISGMIDELQVMMRGNDNRRMGILASRIFDLDPGNAAAMRMRLFVLENSGRIPEAWKLVQEQLEAAPRKARIYYTAFDMMSRYPQLRRELAGVTAQFRKNISDPDAYDFAVWTLLGRFDFDSAALAGAAALYGDSLRLSRNMKRSSDSLAGHYSSGALLAARLGDLKKAVELQGRALEYRRSSGNTSAVFAAEKMLEYFIQCTKTAVKW